VTLPGVDAYPTLAAQAARFTSNGFSYANAATLRTIRSQNISNEERERWVCRFSARTSINFLTFSHRIARLEMLDEIEELELVLQHYMIGWGVKATEDSPFAAWNLPSQV